MPVNGYVINDHSVNGADRTTERYENMIINKNTNGNDKIMKRHELSFSNGPIHHSYPYTEYYITLSMLAECTC